MLASRDFVYKTQDTAKAPLHASCDCEVIPDWGEKYNQAILRGYDPRVYNRIYNQASELWETADANRLNLEKGRRSLTEDEQRIVDYATKSTIRWYGNKAVRDSPEYRRWNRQGKSKEEIARHDRELNRLRNEAETNIRNDLNSKKPLNDDQSWHMISSIMRLQNPQNLTDGQRIEDAMVGDMKMSDWMTFRDKLAQRYLTTTKRSDKMPPLVPENIGGIALPNGLKITAKGYNHIAYGAYNPKDKKFLGGHLNGFGWVQGKDEFPADWTMDDVLKAAKYIIQHPIER